MHQGRLHERQQKEQRQRLWLALKLVPRLAVAHKIALVEKYTLERLFFDSDLVSSLPLQPAQANGFLSPKWQKIDDILTSVTSADAEMLCFDDNAYPPQLKEIHDPPLVIFVRGDKSLLSKPQIAIVGSRNATVYGLDAAKNFATEICQLGFIVTSGLAIGIDAHAHKAAVDAKGHTVAVIATGIDKDYPARNKALAHNIITNAGVVLTEFLPGTPPKPGHFPKRNRIISGLSVAVLVIEATIKSGSLITAKSALDQNREVYALPGSIHNPQARGCHWLIKQGAKLVESAADIEEELGGIVNFGLNLNKINNKENSSKKSCIEDLSNDPLLASVGYEITPVDKVVSRSKLPTDVVLTRLTMLELRGLVTAVPGGYLKIK